MSIKKQQVLQLWLIDFIYKKNDSKNCLISSNSIGCNSDTYVDFLRLYIEPSISAETILYMRGFADVAAASNIGIGFLLIVASSIRDHESARKVLLGELGLMSCLLIVAVFNTLNAGIIVDSGQPSPFWILLIANPVLCTYGLLKDKQWSASYYSP